MCFLNRCNLHHRVFQNSDFIKVFLGLALILHSHLTTAQPMEIRKTIKEELLPGSLVVDLSADPDFMNVVRYALNSGSINKNASSGSPNLHYSILTSAHGQFFAVETFSGKISIRRRIDREQVCSFRDECQLNFQVAARSLYGAFFLLINLNIIVIDINDNSPEFTQTQFLLEIPENAEVGRSFPLPTAFDRDAGVSNKVQDYKILSGPDLFVLKTIQTSFNSTDIFLRLEQALVSESAMVYKVLVGAVDGGIPPLTGTLTVEVTISDVNDNFPIFEESLYLKTIPETAGVDQVIVQVKATDADSGLNGQVIYTFSALQPQDDLSFFRVDAQTGEIFLARSVEARAGDDIELIVEAADRGHPPKTSRTIVQIHVEDTINSLPDIHIDTLGGTVEGVAEVSEYAEVGKVVAYVSVRDPDSGDNGRTSCSLSVSEFQLVFLDDGKYKVELMTSVDREVKGIYNITLTCSDSGFPPLTAHADFAVKVFDENDQEPVFSHDSYEASIPENNPVGAVITQLTVTDGDIGRNAEISFDVIGPNKQFFDIDETGTVTAAVSLDREYSGRIVVTVVAMDHGSPPLSASATLIVNLQDVNDMEPQFSKSLYHFEVEEEVHPGRFVGTLSATDEDLGVNKEIMYRIQDSHRQSSDLFSVGNLDGVIRTNAVFDRELKEFHSLIVLAIDKGVPPLTGTASVIIKILDTNDNDPFFIFPVPDNNTISIPHTVKPRKQIATVQAFDIDADLNAEIIYSISSVNASAPFAIDPISGVILTKDPFAKSDTGIYALTIMANDQGPKQQRATQIPMYIEVFFDNSTILAAANTSGLSKEVIAAVTAVGMVMVFAVVMFVTILCIKRHKATRKLNTAVPNSASTSSTAKLQGGYYIAPGVSGSSPSFTDKQNPGLSSPSFTEKQNPGTFNNNVVQDSDDGMRTTNPYIVVLPRTESEAPAEIIEISISGYQNGYGDTLEMNRLEDDRFSTFRSQEDILTPGLRYGSLRRQFSPFLYQNPESPPVNKKANDTSDDMSGDDSMSDSGRGGSDVDVNNGAAAAKQDKARTKNVTPISVKNENTHRLSPYPQRDGNLITFRGESPNLFNIDLDAAPRNSRTSKGNSQATIPAESRKEIPKVGSGPASAFSGPSGQNGDKYTDNNPSTRHNLTLHPLNSNSKLSFHDYERPEERGQTGFPQQLEPPNTSFSYSTYPRHDHEAVNRGRGLNPSNSLTRRNPVPFHLPSEHTGLNHHAYGTAFNNNNNNHALKSQGSIPDHYALHPESYHSQEDFNRVHGTSYKNLDRRGGSSGRYQDSFSRVPMTGNYSNDEDNSPDVHPHNMEEHFLLPPYPEVEGQEEDDVLNIHPGYSDFNQDKEAEKLSLFSKSRFESSA